MSKTDLKNKLDKLYLQFNQAGFIENDPIAIPHQFSKKEDIEIMSFLISSIAWGQRTSIINSGKRLVKIFEGKPFDFILNHRDTDLKACRGFVHRTFNETDLISFVSFLKEIYQQKGGLEYAFSKHLSKDDLHIENALNGFRASYESSPSFIKRTARHIAYPAGGSACKRLNMFLRWMVRSDENGIDFGIWKSIKPSQLICPLDVHVINQALQLGLIKSEKSNWKTALELTARLRIFDSKDPVKYDIALFGNGVNEKSINKTKRNLFKQLSTF